MARFVGKHWSDALINGLGLMVLLWIVWITLDWTLLSAAGWSDSRESCGQRSGACWPFIAEKLRLIAFGTYPYGEQWRPLFGSVLLIGMVIMTGIRVVELGPRWPIRWLVGAWIGVLPGVWILMGGGLFGLDVVPTSRWNGLPVLLILAIASLAVAVVLGILLAFARARSASSMVRRCAALYVDGMRAIPMVSVLFVGVFVLPLTLPRDIHLDPMISVLVVLMCFHAAYVAEDVRAGIESIPSGQTDAGYSLGLSSYAVNRLVVLPQAMQQALPALLNTVIGAYKDTSLVLILGLFDLVATARMAFSDPLWQGHALEAYSLVGLWFFVSCAFLSWVGRRLDRRSTQLASSARHN